MRTQHKIIKLFIQEPTGKTIREISKKIKADYRITHTAVQKLLESKLLLGKTVGKSTFCTLNPTYYGADIYSAELERKSNLLENQNIKIMYNELMQGISSSFFVSLLFGSYAKKSFTKHSDIDLLFICNERKFEEKIGNLLSLLPLKTHTFVFTDKEFIRMKHSPKPNVVKEAINNNIILYGVENYYRLKGM